MPTIKEYPKDEKSPWDILPSTPVKPWEPFTAPYEPLEDKEIECPLCKMVWKGVMSYCCPNVKCPIQPKAIC